MKQLIKAIHFVLVVGLGAVSAEAFAYSGSISGVATAKDGDDVVVLGVDLRLQGIAAPEDNSRKREVGGPEATASMSALIEGKIVRCEFDGTKARGRPVAICFINGKDLGEMQVFAGHARDCPRFSKGRYAKAETIARNSGRDLSAIYRLPPYCRAR